MMLRHEQACCVVCRVLQYAMAARLTMQLSVHDVGHSAIT